MNNDNILDQLLVDYQNKFPSNWIGKKNWQEKTIAKDSYQSGFQLVDEYSEDFFISIGKELLSGSMFVETVDDKIQALIDLCTDEFVLTEKNQLQQDLYDKFSNLNSEIKNIFGIIRQKRSNISNMLDFASHEYVVVAVKAERVSFKNPYFAILSYLLDCIDLEFQFSNSQGYVQELILLKAKIDDMKKNIKEGQSKAIVEAILTKIVFLLSKLTHFSQDKKIEYFLNFEHVSITPSDELIKKFQDYQKLLYWLEPKKVDNNVVEQWQQHIKCKEGEIQSLGEVILLMRYYTKHNRNASQVNNLLTAFNRYYNKIYSSSSQFDKFALKSIKSYLYNSRFAFMISNGIAFKDLKDNFNEIDALQSETFMFNYHPHYRTCKYVIQLIKEAIQHGSELVIINEMREFLNRVMRLYERGFMRCRKMQMYPFQLTYSECLTVVSDDIQMFNPSSFCKPIKYHEVQENFERCKLEIMAIDSELMFYERINKVEELNHKVEQQKRSYAEILGVFSIVLTFLTASVTIFSGDVETKVPLREKVEHIAILGVILLLFVSAGYFCLNNDNNKSKTFKFWFFLITSIAYIIALLKYVGW